MSSFMFSSFDLTIGWYGYSFEDNLTNLYVGLLTPTFFEGTVATTARATYDNITDMSSYLLASVDGYKSDTKLLNVRHQVSADKTSILMMSDDVSWYPTTLSASGAVIYDGNGMLICVIDFGTVKTTVKGTLTLPFSSGIIRIR